MRRHTMPVTEADLQKNPLVETLLAQFDELRKKVREAGAEKGIDLPEPPDLLVFRGFIGASDENGFTRVYDDSSLSSYTDLPNEYLVHVEHLEKSPSRPWGEDVIWIVRGDIQITELEIDGVHRRSTVYRPARTRRRR
jgi:hypothetical protein